MVNVSRAQGDALIVLLLLLIVATAKPGPYPPGGKAEGQPAVGAGRYGDVQPL